MTEKEKLYETLGELLYAIAKADGVIQNEEKEALNTLLAEHKYAHEIKWSFEYEEHRDATVEELYKKVIDHCYQIGPSQEYEEFIDAMKTIADAVDGTLDSEEKIIESFSKDLTERFKHDLEKIS